MPTAVFSGADAHLVEINLLSMLEDGWSGKLQQARKLEKRTWMKSKDTNLLERSVAVYS